MPLPHTSTSPSFISIFGYHLALRTLYAIAIALSLLALISYALSSHLPTYIHQRIDTGILHAVVFNSTTNDAFTAWSNWSSPLATPVYISVYMYNITNPSDIISPSTHNNTDAKPSRSIITQHGPYTFRVYKQRYNVTFNTNPGDAYTHEPTVTYNEWKYYVYEDDTHADDGDDDTEPHPRRSHTTAHPRLSLNDTYTTVNLVFQGYIHSPFAADTHGVYHQLYNRTQGVDVLFTRRTVREILFGYTDEVTGQSLYRGVLPNMTHPLDDPMHYDAKTHSIPQHTMYTGAGSGASLHDVRSAVERYGQRYHRRAVNVLDKKHTIPLWGSEEANRVYGSEGDVFDRTALASLLTSRQHSHETQHTVLHALVPELYRTIPLHNNHSHTRREHHNVHGIALHRFTPSDASYHNATRNPVNAAYHQYRYNGVFNSTAAYNDVPIFISKPYMCGGVDAYVRSNVRYVHHNKSHPRNDDGAADGNEHEHDEPHVCHCPHMTGTYLDIEPHTGVTMRASKKYQVNVHLQPVNVTLDTSTSNSDVSYELWFSQLHADLLQPICWIDEHAAIDHDRAKEFRHKVINSLYVADHVSTYLYVFGNVCMAATVALMSYLLYVSKSYTYIAGDDEQTSSGNDMSSQPEDERNTDNASLRQPLMG